MPVAERLVLAHERKFSQSADFADFFQLFFLVLLLKPVLKFKVTVKMILDGALADRCDKDDFLDSARDCLLDDILDNRLINHGEHLFWLGLGSRQKTRSHAGNRNNRFSNRHISVSFVHYSRKWRAGEIEI